MERSKGLNERALFLQQEDADKGGFNNAARQQYQDASLSVRPLSPFISFRFPIAALFQAWKNCPLLTYKTNVCPKVAHAHPRDVICARAPATQSSRGFIGGAAPA